MSISGASSEVKRASVLCGAAVALGVVYLSGLLQPLIPMLILVGCLALGHLLPKVALTLSIAVPFTVQMTSISGRLSIPADLMGAVLAIGVVLGARSGGRHDGRILLGKKLVPFALINFAILVLLPHGIASASSLAEAMMHALTFAMAVAALRPNLPDMARIVGLSGVIVSFSAYSTPALLIDRTTSVTGQNANGIGMVASLCLVAAAISVVKDAGGWRAFHVFVSAACVLGVFVSQSRGAYLNLAIAGSVLVSRRLVMRRAVAGYVGVAAFGLLVLWVGSAVVQWAGTFTGRFAVGQDETESLQSRVTAAIYSVEQGIVHPLSGVGLTNLPDYSNLHHGDISVRSHIVYVGVFGEVGLIASAILIAVSGIAFINSRRCGLPHLALVSAVLVSGISLNWWPSSGTGALALGLLAWGVVLRTSVEDGQIAGARRESSGDVVGDSDLGIVRSAGSTHNSTRKLRG